jgi:Delta7-sterol 5-desaturase
MGIYFIHRALHHPLLYKSVHKPHHKWLVPTPYAFYWIDGFLQSTPYHIFVFLFPLHKWTYLALFIFVNFWTVSIHDGYNAVPTWLQNIVNGSAHHTDHHLYFNFNYGEFFTFWDIIGGSHRNPRPDLKTVMDKDMDERIPETAEMIEKLE